MDQGVLETVKRAYRHKLLTVLVAGMDSEEDVSTILKNINLLDVVMWVSDAWKEIKPLTLVKSWRKLLEHNASETWDGEVLDNADKQVEVNKDDGEIIKLLQTIPGCENIDHRGMKEWMAEDELNELTDSDIIEMVRNPKMPEPEQNEEKKKNTMSHSEAVQAIEALMDYVEQQDEAGPNDVMLLRRWRDIAAKKRVQRVKQPKISTFFQK